MSDIDRIPWAKPHLFGEEEQEMMRALRSEWISGGPFLQELESMVADIVGVKHALATANGTAAIHLVYLGLGLSAGDEVVVPGFAYQAASNVALLAGLRPVFADVTPDTWCLDPDDVRRALTPKTKAVMAVHSYGNVCAMDALRQVCEESGIVLLEDAAESFGSAWRGKLSGGIAHAGTLSFHATKTITTGEGGMVLTDDDELADKVALYRSHGMRRQKVYYWHELPGHNFRLTNFQAAMGCAQIRHYDEVCSRRRALQANYVKALATLEGATLQRFEPAVHAVPWSMPVKLAAAVYPQGRDSVLLQMHKCGVECRPGFYTPEQMAMPGAPFLPVADDLARTIINLPMFHDMTDEQLDFVVQNLRSLCA